MINSKGICKNVSWPHPLEVLHFRGPDPPQRLADWSSPYLLVFKQKDWTHAFECLLELRAGSVPKQLVSFFANNNTTLVVCACQSDSCGQIDAGANDAKLFHSTHWAVCYRPGRDSDFDGEAVACQFLS